MILARGSFLTHSLSIMPQLRAMSGFSYLGGGRGRGRESEGERGEGRRERRREKEQEGGEEKTEVEKGKCLAGSLA